MTTSWTADHVRAIDPARAARVPVITQADHAGLDPQRIYWDMWPIAAPDGRPATIAGRELWMALTAPDRADPSLRHFEAKIRLLQRTPSGWLDLGDVLPAASVPYEREWAGSAVIENGRLSLYFTAAGVADRPGGYQQRLFETHGHIGEDGLPTGWTTPVPSITRFAPHYMLADAHDGEPGRIKAFRDPAWFRDPADGAEYLLFTASRAGVASDFNGAVGIARKVAGGWELLPPLIDAVGVNNELERAHMVFHHGRYYVFWVTQGATFAPGLRQAPNGLYGMAADSLLGPYQPLNGSGLVLCNPAHEPLQTYSWFVTGDLQVSAFVDFWGLAGQDGLAATEADRFGGVPAPLLQLEIDNACCRLAGNLVA